MAADYPGKQSYEKVSIQLGSPFTQAQVDDVVVEDSMDISWDEEDLGVVRAQLSSLLPCYGSWHLLWRSGSSSGSG